MKTHSPKKFIFLILILGSLMALAPFSIDMYLPGFAVIATDLHTTMSQVMLSLSSFFIGIAAGQLLYGPLLDRFGRKKPLYVGLVVYIIASAGCMAVRTVDELIWIRLVQAIGGCAASVAALAMVRDLFPVKESPKIFANLMLVIALSPMAAPTLGGYVTEYYGWQAVFLILSIMGAAILLASFFFLPESYKPDTSISLKPAPILRNFYSVIITPQFYTYALTGSISFSGLFVYVAGSPMVFMEIFGASKTEFSWIFAGLSIALIGSGQVNSLLLKKYTSQQIVKTALICSIVFSLLFALFALNNWLTQTSTIIFLSGCLFCVGITMPNFTALALAPFEKNAGSASSVLGALQMGIGSAASAAVGMFELHSIIPMATVMAGTTVLATAVLLVCSRQIRPTEAGMSIVE